MADAINSNDTKATSPCGAAHGTPHGRRYWLYTPGKYAEYQNLDERDCVMALGCHDDFTDVDLMQFATPKELKEGYKLTGEAEKTRSKQLWDLSHRMQQGDVVYMRKGKTQIIGCGIVTGGYTRGHDADRPAYAHRRPVAWMRDFVAFDLPQYVSDMVLPKHNFPQTLVEITVSQDFLSELAARLLETQTGNVMAYTPILREDITFADKLISTVLASGNVILRGAPGTGKTYLARQAAARIVSGGTAGTFEDLSPDQRQQIGFVQFHPSFDYSDFVEGLRPVL